MQEIRDKYSQYVIRSGRYNPDEELKFDFTYYADNTCDLVISQGKNRWDFRYIPLPELILRIRGRLMPFKYADVKSVLQTCNFIEAYKYFTEMREEWDLTDDEIGILAYRFSDVYQNN